jgi:hypothetical protein
MSGLMVSGFEVGASSQLQCSYVLAGSSGVTVKP